MDPYCDPTPIQAKHNKASPINVSGASDELLPAVDVVRRTGERGVDHEVYSERGDIGGTHDATDRQRGPQRAPALLELINGYATRGIMLARTEFAKVQGTSSSSIHAEAKSGTRACASTSRARSHR